VNYKYYSKEETMAHLTAFCHDRMGYGNTGWDELFLMGLIDSARMHLGQTPIFAEAAKLEMERRKGPRVMCQGDIGI